MTTSQDLGAVAKAIIDANLYMTLATADGSGRPWASPVYFASPDCVEFFWMSSPDATHSRNIAARPQVGIVIFDSHAPANTGQAVYLSGVAEELAGVDLDRGVEAYNGRFPDPAAHGLRKVTRHDLSPPALHRLYRASVAQHSVLDPAGHPVHGRAIDHRTPVVLEPGPAAGEGADER